MATTSEIEMQVHYHPSDRYSLMERVPGTTVWTDAEASSLLFKNSDATSFYRAVAKRMASLAANNVKVVSYLDTTP